MASTPMVEPASSVTVHLWGSQRRAFWSAISPGMQWANDRNHREDVIGYRDRVRLPVHRHDHGAVDQLRDAAQVGVEADADVLVPLQPGGGEKRFAADGAEEDLGVRGLRELLLLAAGENELDLREGGAQVGDELLPEVEGHDCLHRTSLSLGYGGREL